MSEENKCRYCTQPIDQHHAVCSISGGLGVYYASCRVIHQQAEQIARLTAERDELAAKLKSTERALDAYACQLWNEANL